MKIKSISKHVLAIVLSLAVLASTMMLNTFSAFATDEGTGITYWDGTIAQPTNEEDPYSVYESGTGTELDPYIISTPEQLAYLVATIPNNGTLSNLTNGKYFELANDIYLNNVTSDTWYENEGNKEWYSKGQDDKPFQNHSSFLGTLDGAGHTIYGLYFNRDATSVSDKWFGLFPILRGTIKNLRISRSYVSTKDTNNNVMVGAFAACVRGTDAKITNCVVDDTTVRGYMVGGFVGSFNEAGDWAQNTKLVIDNCYSKATVITTFTWSTKRLNRMFVGEYRETVRNNKTHTVEINNSYAVGDVDLAPPTVNAENGNFVTTIKNCYTTKSDSTEAGVTVRTLSEMTGAKAKVYMNAFDFNNVWYTEAGKTPQLRFGDIEKVNATKLWNVWDGTVPETVTYDGGNGQSAATAYEISTAEQLAYLVSKGSSGYYKLTDDIYLNDVSDSEWYNNTPNEWSAVVGANTNFWGTVDGNGHTIYGLYINSGLYFTGLIPRFVGGTISNLRISKSYVKNTGYDGGHGVLVGQIWQNRNVRNCVIDETVEFITAGYGSPLIGGLNDDGANLTGTVNVEGCYVAAKMSTTHADTKPAAFFGKPITAKGITYSPTASHLVIKKSYYSGEYALAAEKADGPVIYDGCYTTKVYDTENGETVPTGVIASSNLEAMKAAGLSAVLAKFPKLGNANGDANAAVDVCDLVTLKKLELGMAVVLDIYGSDVNNDREINGLDYLALQKYILNDLSVFQ